MPSAKPLTTPDSPKNLVILHKDKRRERATLSDAPGGLKRRLFLSTDKLSVVLVKDLEDLDLFWRKTHSPQCHPHIFLADGRKGSLEVEQNKHRFVFPEGIELAEVVHL